MTPTTAAERAKKRANELQEERVEETAETLLEDRDPDCEDPDVLEAAAERAAELEREERIEELQERARSIVEDHVEAMQRSTAAAGGLDQEIRRLREALVQKLAARRKRADAYQRAKVRAEVIAEVLELGEVPRVEPPGGAPEIDVESRAKERAEVPGVNRKSVEARTENLVFADGPEDGRRNLRRLRKAFDGEAAEIIQKYGELVLIPRKEQAAEQRRRKELEKEAKAWVRELKRGNDPGTISDLPLPVQAALRSIRNEWRESYRIDEKAAARKIEAAVEESEVAVD